MRYNLTTLFYFVKRLIIMKRSLPVLGFFTDWYRRFVVAMVDSCSWLILLICRQNWNTPIWLM